MEGSESLPPAPSPEVPPNQSQLPADEEKRTHIKFLLSNYDAGAVIGHDGSMITSIMSTSRANIKVSRNSQFFPGTYDRIIMVAGAVGHILHAVHLILTRPMNLFSVEDLESTVTLVVPNKSCGAIMGNGGATIRSMVQDSQAGINVFPLDPHYPGLHDRLVMVTGTLGQRMHAIKLILLILVECTYYEQYGNKLYPYAAPQYREVYPHPALQYREVYHGPVLYSLPNREYIRHWMIIDIADEHAGLVIGHGGENIRKMAMLSGATITISVRGDFVPGTSNRRVTMTGSPEAIRAAEYMIWQTVAER